MTPTNMTATEAADAKFAELMDLAWKLASAEHARLSMRKGYPTMGDVRLHAARNAAAQALESALAAWKVGKGKK